MDGNGSKCNKILLYFTVDGTRQAAGTARQDHSYKERNQDCSGGGHVVSIVRTGQGPGSCLVIQTSSRVHDLHTSPYKIDPSTKAKLKKKKNFNIWASSSRLRW